jgi:ppGpp synthetase/RelA/SpoT-type nucleotidyltranferase
MSKTKKDSQTELIREQVEKFKKVYPRYKKYAEVLEKILGEVRKRYAPMGIVRVRPKSISSFAEKIMRKPTPRKDPVNEFTDLCGGRVITTTSSEVEAICKFIENHFNIDWENSIDVSKRHKPAEFGYRSVHYIVSFRKGVFPTKDINVSVPKVLFPDKQSPMKAEIQVRTLLEHAWAIFAHDRTYKSSFRIPDMWERELAAVAALLEGADKAFERIRSGLKMYSSSYEGYMTENQMKDEIELLDFILSCEPGNVELVSRIGQLAVKIDDWEKAIDILSPHVDSKYQPILKTLGIAMCKKYNKNPKSSNYRKGQRYLEAAIKADKNDADAVASLAGTWKRLDDDKARELYRQAFEIDPSDPYPLENYLTYEILKRKDIEIVSTMAPVMNSSIKRCREQIEVSVNIPWAYYSIGKFYLLLGRPDESLSAYARAIQLSTARFMIETSLHSLNQLSAIQENLSGYDWIKKLLLVGLTTRFPIKDSLKKDSLKEVESLATKGCEKIQEPVVIVAGGCDPAIESMMRGYKNLLIEAFRGFKGTIISGGTKQGISGLVGDLREKYTKAIQTIGYLPRMIPADATVDKNTRRYKELRYTEGSGFTPLEPLQNWIDIIDSGINPSEVKVLGINGGRIASIEYKIALALGAKVALIEESGREASKLMTDADWINSEGLVSLPADPQTVRAFIGSGRPKLNKKTREFIAKAFHEKYRVIQRDDALRKDQKIAESLKDWKHLKKNLKESNRQAADHIFEKLRQIGCEVYKVKGRKINLIEFSKKEIEIMAEMEHGRWNTERLLDGWKWGEKKDIDKKINPCLVSWEKLPEDTKQWDRDMVSDMPRILAKIGLEIRRLKK